MAEDPTRGEIVVKNPDNPEPIPLCWFESPEDYERGLLESGRQLIPGSIQSKLDTLVLAHVWMKNIWPLPVMDKDSSLSTSSGNKGEGWTLRDLTEQVDKFIDYSSDQSSWLPTFTIFMVKISKTSREHRWSPGQADLPCQDLSWQRPHSYGFKSLGIRGSVSSFLFVIGWRAALAAAILWMVSCWCCLALL